MPETKNCVPCSTGTPRLQDEVLKEKLRQLGHGWTLTSDHHLEKEFAFKDFKEALEFTDKLGALAEAQNHHPDIYLSWGKVRVTIWTHKIDGLSENDFVLANKMETI